MSDRLQGSELDRVGEYDIGQQLAVYLAFENDMRPSLGDRGQRLRIEDEMADGVGIDHPYPPLGQ